MNKKYNLSKIILPLCVYIAGITGLCMFIMSVMKALCINDQVATEVVTTNIESNNASIEAGVTLEMSKYLSMSELNTEQADTVTRETNIVQSGHFDNDDVIIEAEIVYPPEWEMVSETMYVNTALNIRSEANPNSDVIGYLEPNNIVYITAKKSDTEWVQIKLNSGDTGYVHSKYLQNEKITEVYMGKWIITAYCPCYQCCKKTSDNPNYGYAANGNKATAGRTIAMYGVPFGTKYKINGHVYTVEDRGTPYGHIDIYCNTHEEARQWGKQLIDVYKIIE